MSETEAIASSMSSHFCEINWNFAKSMRGPFNCKLILASEEDTCVPWCNCLPTEAGLSTKNPKALFACIQHPAQPATIEVSSLHGHTEDIASQIMANAEHATNSIT